MEVPQLNKSRMRQQLLSGDLGGLDHSELHDQTNIEQSPQTQLTPSQLNLNTSFHNNNSFGNPGLYQQQQVPMRQHPMGMSQQQPMGLQQQQLAYLQQQQQQQQQMQFQQQQMGLLNLNLKSSSNSDFGIPLPSSSSSRKASLTSQSGINRFFKRNKSHAEDLNFNEDHGADIGELTNGAKTSLKDITHIRDRGAYAINSKNRFDDTTPLIPMVGTINPTAKATNNLQYRKQMNHQMKLAYASGARASSMNTQLNPMGPNNPRTMSFNNDPRTQSFNNDPRAQSLNTFTPQNPRSMSLLNNAGPQTVSYASNGGYPRSNTLNQQYPPGITNQQFPLGPRSNSMTPDVANGPRSMSMRNMPFNPGFQNNGQPIMNQYPPRQNFQGQPGFNHNTQQQRFDGKNQHSQQHINLPQGRANSLGTQSRNIPPSSFQPQLAPQGRTGLLANQQGYSQAQSHGNYLGQFQNPAEMPFGGQPLNQGNNFSTAYMNAPSNDSLTNVPEEDDDAISRRNTLAPARAPMPGSDDKSFGDGEYTAISLGESRLTSLNKTLDSNDQSHGDDSSSISSKSTIRRSNSTKLRKLDLFNTKKQEKIETTIEEPENEILGANDLDSEIDLNEIDESYYEARSKEISLNTSEGNFNNLEDRKIVGVLAGVDSEEHKPGEFKPDSNLIMSNPSDLGFEGTQTRSDKQTHSAIVSDPDTKPGETKDNTDHHAIAALPAKRVLSNESTDLNSYKSIVANTVFNNFRSPSETTNSTFVPDADKGSLNIGEPPQNEYRFSLKDDLEEPLKIGVNRTVSVESSVYSTNSVQYGQKQPDLHDSLDKSSDSREAIDYSAVTTDESHTATGSGIYKGNSLSSRMIADAYGDLQLRSELEERHEQDHDFDSEQLSKTITELSIDSKSDPRGEDIVRTNQSSSDNFDRPPVQAEIPRPLDTEETTFYKAATIDSSPQPISKDNVKTELKRQSLNESLSNKSKNFFRRLSKGRRPNVSDLESNANTPPRSRKSSQTGSDLVLHQDIPTNFSRKPSIKTLPTVMSQGKTLHFTKEELGIMNCNNDLLTELELVTTELASSIRRELAVGSRFKSNNNDSAQEIAVKSKALSDLQEKLNRERRLRFISEEHALMWEHGQEPSALKINYEKNEMYKQLLIKNDEVIQMEDKLAEYEGHGKANDSELLAKYNKLLDENSHLKFQVIPDLERKLYDSAARIQSANESFDESFNYDESQEEISVLKSQREDLRETVSKLNSNHNYELKQAYDRINLLENKVSNLKLVNDKLTRRGDENLKNKGTPSGNKRGKLDFSVVSPDRSFN